MELDSLLVRKTMCWEMEAKDMLRVVKLITHQEPIEGMQAWNIQVIYLDIEVNTGNYNFKRKLGLFPPSPRPPARATFFILISQKLLLNIKDV